MDGVEACAGLIGSNGLLRGGDGDLGDHAVDAFGHADDAFEGLACLCGGDDALFDGACAALHAGDGSAGAILNSLDHAGDLSGGLCGALGETTDFTGDNCETTALISC